MAALQDKKPKSEVDLLIRQLFELHKKSAFAEMRGVSVKILKLSHANPYAIHYLGIHFCRGGFMDRGIRLIKRSIQIDPENAIFYSSLAMQLFLADKYEDALETYKKLLSMVPGIPAIYDNMAKICYDLNRHDESIEYIKKALEISPNTAQFHNMYGVSLLMKNKITEAETEFRKAINFEPRMAHAHWNLARTLFLKNDIAGAFPEIKWRTKSDHSGELLSEIPPPDMYSSKDKTLLINPEQGLGDCINFARFIPLYASFFKKVVFRCPETLIKILGTIDGICELVPRESLTEKDIPHDCELHIMSILSELSGHGLFKPDGKPYIKTDPLLRDLWGGKIDKSKFNVGIIWGGSTTHRRDSTRSIDPALFRILGNIEGVHLYSLQKGHYASGVSAFSGLENFKDISEELKDFSDTAALMLNLDLIITADTSPLHLAGALGVAVWGLISFAPDWRWQLDREDSMWYRSLRLFRQKTEADWNEVFERVSGELQKIVTQKTGKSPDGKK